MNCTPYLHLLVAAAFVCGFGCAMAVVGFMDWRERRRAVGP